MLSSKRIGVLMGGRSAEREVSLRSGLAIEASLRRQGCRVVSFDVDQNIAGELRRENIELAFNALHGRGGEDGIIQGLLESLGIPYTGSGVKASAIGMDKVLTKKLLVQEGIPTPRSFVWKKPGAGHRGDALLPEGMRVPVVVKPNSEGSTFGISIVEKLEDLEPAIVSAREYDEVVLIEEYIGGREMTVGILDGEVLPVIEVVPKEQFYDFEAKYTQGKTEYKVPAPLPPESSERLQKLAGETHSLLGCRGATRVDFRLDNSGKPFVLEINTVPGMTETSLLPKAAAARGISYDELVRRIVLSVPGEKQAGEKQK